MAIGRKTGILLGVQSMWGFHGKSMADCCHGYVLMQAFLWCASKIVCRLVGEIHGAKAMDGEQSFPCSQVFVQCTVFRTVIAKKHAKKNHHNSISRMIKTACPMLQQ